LRQAPTAAILLRNTLRFSLFVLLVGVHAFSSSAQARLDAPTYDIWVRLVTTAQRLDIEAQVTIPPATSPAEALTFQLDPRCSDPEVTIRDGSAAASRLEVARSGNRLTVALAVPTAPGKPTVLEFRYSIGPAGARSFYITGDYAFISGESFAWYPRQSSSRRSTGRLRFTLPDGFVVAATGRYQPAGKVTGPRRDFLVAEPTTFSFAAGRHQVVAQSGSPDLALHLLRARPLAGERLAALRRILDALVHEFGGYLHPDLEVVEMPAAAAGGRDSATSLEGFVVVGPGVMDSFTLPIVAHEVSHQWWADCVFGVGPNSVLLTETMAQYGALRATRAIHGDAAAAEYRWRGYPGESLLAGERGYLSLVLAGLDGPLTSPPASLLPVTKGMLVHDLFSRTVGEERFRTFLQQFLRTHAFSDVTWQIFIDEATAALGDRVGRFARTWYGEEGVPELTLSWTQRDRELRGEVVQRPAYYSGPIDLAVAGAGQRSVISVSLAGEQTDFSVDVQFTVSSVQMDPDHKIPHRSAERIAGTAVVAPLGRAVRLMQTGGADFLSAARETLSAASDAPPERLFLLEALLADDALERGEHERAKAHLRAALAAPSPVRESLPALYYYQAQLAASDNDRELMTRSARAAIETDGMLPAPTGWSLAARELLMTQR
jgi:hypothetical protein